jgi:hypothetical protein
LKIAPVAAIVALTYPTGEPLSKAQVKSSRRKLKSRRASQI